ncbi:MAG: hypothetical protein JW934_01105 [Anaerolineae bacterium]|nr:hypothetical protein [Anaerolineae bacterium]
MEKMALVLSVLLFAGIYVAGFVMSLQEVAQKVSDQVNAAAQSSTAAQSGTAAQSSTSTQAGAA